jgi:hypothetical protein
MISLGFLNWKKWHMQQSTKSINFDIHKSNKCCNLRHRISRLRHAICVYGARGLLPIEIPKKIGLNFSAFLEANLVNFSTKILIVNQHWSTEIYSKLNLTLIVVGESVEPAVVVVGYGQKSQLHEPVLLIGVGSPNKLHLRDATASTPPCGWGPAATTPPLRGALVLRRNKGNGGASISAVSQLGISGKFNKRCGRPNRYQAAL